MGVDAGFDIYPPLEAIPEHQEKYTAFLDDIITEYRDEDAVFKLNPDSEDIYIEFVVGEHPHLPRDCHRFFRFGSKVSGRSMVGPYLEDVCKIVKRHFGDRVHFWNDYNEFGSYVDHSGCYNWNEVRAGRRRTTQLRPIRTMKALSEEPLPTASELTAMKLLEVKEVPRKGLGLITTTKISKGMRIMLEAALFTMPDAVGSVAAAEAIVLREVKQLSSEQRRAFLCLLNIHKGEFSPLLGIAKTNMLPISPMGGREGAGALFLQASRINHSCRPNAHYAWNDNIGRLTVHALCDIEAGTEITISYINGVSMTYLDRQRHLQGTFSFACACQLCSLPVPCRSLSDQRVLEIGIIENQLDGRALHPDQIGSNYAKLLDKVRRLLKLFDEEGIQNLGVVDVLTIAFQIAVTIGDKARAQAFAEKACIQRKLMSGADHPMVSTWKRLAERPVEHPLYGKSMQFWGQLLGASSWSCRERV